MARRWPPSTQIFNETHDGLDARVLLAGCCCASGQRQQFGRRRGGRGGFFSTPGDVCHARSLDGGFQFCRIVFRNINATAGWSVDWPPLIESVHRSRADACPGSMDEEQQPKHSRRLTDSESLRCGFDDDDLARYFDDQKPAGLRDYLIKVAFSGRPTSGRVCVEFWTSQLLKVLAAPISDRGRAVDTHLFTS